MSDIAKICKCINSTGLLGYHRLMILEYGQWSQYLVRGRRDGKSIERKEDISSRR